jgi:hypothetical protein
MSGLQSSMGRSVLALLAAFASCAAVGCINLNRVAVNTTASVLVEAQNTTRAYFDWESGGYAAASGVMQLEGLHAVSPDNEDLSLMLTKAYMAYAYGWVMDAHDVAEMRGDYEESEHHQQRAYLMYSRARNLAMHVLALRDPKFPEVVQQDPKVLRAYLEKHFHDAKNDVAPLFWLVMSWSTAINASPDSTEFVDMPAIRTIAEWIAKLDEGYEDAGILVFLGGFASSYPKQVGGDPVKGKMYFERALQLTQRRNHIMLVNYAVLYAISVQDRALYLSLLHEVIEAGDQGPLFRLGNKVAKRRAQRYLQRVDEFFMQ